MQSPQALSRAAHDASSAKSTTRNRIPGTICAENAASRLGSRPVLAPEAEAAYGARSRTDRCSDVDHDALARYQ
eukprot:475119-Rhodomonas_salina.1